MGIKEKSYFLMLMLIFGSVAPFVTAEFNNPTNDWQASNPTLDSYYKGEVDNYWPILNNLENDECSAKTSDFIVAIPVGGCSPGVVRSDLLAEQNVPVFCQLSAIRVNPLIDVSTIKSISFKGDYPEEVAGISFHPARAAISSTTSLIGDPIEQNIGYVVIVLKKQPNENDMAEYVSGMLTATVNYDAQTSFGTSAGSYYLETMTDSEWEKNAPYSSFWSGKGYLRTTRVEGNSATVDVMTSKDEVLKTITLEEGETSEDIYYPGQYCTASIQLKLNKIANSEDAARLDIDGDSIWVRKGDKLFDGKCVVTKVDVLENDGGRVDVSCGSNNKFHLTLGEVASAFVEESDISFDYGVNTYTATSSEIIEREGRQYERVGKVWHWKDDDGSAFGIVSEASEGKDDYVVFLELANKAVAAYSLIREEPVISSGKYSIDSNIPKYEELAEETTLSLIEDYPYESKDTEEYWGEEVLHNQIMLAGDVANNEAQLELINLFLDKYPMSSSFEYFQDLKISLQKYDFGGSSELITLNNKDHILRVEGFSKDSGVNDNVNVRINDGSLTSLNRNKVYDKNFEEIIDEKKKRTAVPRLIVTSISGNGARVGYTWKNSDEKVSSKSFDLENGKFATVGDLEILAVDTSIREVAYVSVIPKVKGEKAEANFTFNIGIEKRAIELTPEKANEKIEELNESITEWEDRIESLGKLVSGMKAACFGVSAVLNFKSLTSGFSGSSFGREDVMDAYEQKCRSEGFSSSAELHECYSKYSNEIESSVNDYNKAVKSVNSLVKCAKTETTVASGLFDSKVVDSEAYVDELSTCTGLDGAWSYDIQGVIIEKRHLTDARDYQAVLLFEEACKEGETAACEIATEQMESALMDNVDRVRVMTEEEEIEDIVKISVPAAVGDSSAVAQQVVSASGNGIGADENNYLAQVYNPDSRNKRYYVEVDKSGSIVNVYSLAGVNVNATETIEATEDLKNRIARDNQFYLPEAEGTSCTNVMSTPYVRYYETGNQQGFVSVVPFDIRNGWYAYVDNNNYDESGEVNAFWICNVGKDGKISDGPVGGDVCTRFSTNIGSNVLFTPCKEKTQQEITTLYSKAGAAIREANRDGNGINVDGKYVGKTSPKDPSGSDLECTDFMSVDDCNLMFNVCDPVICPSSRCDMGGKYPVADVISTGIIGSVALCLPNFGSPSEGGVAIPVCLSGIHAGLDSYVSILKSHRSCLEQNVESGEYTGICDEITAIYTCEFFWGQVTPLLDNMLPSMVSSLYGGVQTKGGAEYLTAQSAFDNLESSVDYFTKNYAENAFRSFNLQNTEEIGTTVCKGFLGTSMPTSVGIIDDLLKPESPSQFYASFSEDAYSGATVPSTSHYKIYYHIYAGNDEGVQYKVSLRNPPETSYYASRQTVIIDSGYAAAGTSADESIDVTMPSGYKELCVNINGVEECGFGKVTSDFGLDYATQLYTEDQASTSGITKTEDCVTTSASSWGMVDLNLQSGVETSLGGEDIATTGITRICASANPEQGITSGNDVYCEMEENENGENPRCSSGYSCNAVGGEAAVGPGVCENSNGLREVSQGRWVDVGYCDNENVRCWLDSISVKDNLGAYSAVNDVVYVDDLVMESSGLKELAEEYHDVRDALNVIEGKIETLEIETAVDESGKLNEEATEIIEMCDNVAGVGENVGQGLNVDKAEALALKAELYRLITRTLMKGAPEIVKQGTVMSDKEVAQEILEAESKDEENGETKTEAGVNGDLSSAEKPTFTQATGFRTDRHNNPTSFILQIAEMAEAEGAISAGEYSRGDSFVTDGTTYYTARLIGDSIDITTRVIDALGFYTDSGKQRWDHTAMSDEVWNNLKICEKAGVIEVMYSREGGNGSIFDNYGDDYICEEYLDAEETIEEVVDTEVTAEDMVISIGEQFEEEGVFAEVVSSEDAVFGDVKQSDILQDDSGNKYRVLSSTEGGWFSKKQTIELNPFDDSVDNFEIKDKIERRLKDYGDYEFQIIDNPSIE